MIAAYAITAATMRAAPMLGGQRVAIIPALSQVTAEPTIGGWRRVTWRTFSGWVYAPLIEDIQPPPPELQRREIVTIPPDMDTGATVRQYIKLEGRIKYNLCGQFCAAQSAGVGIAEWLAAYRAARPLDYAAFVTADRPSGTSALIDMLRVYSTGVLTITTALNDDVAGPLVSPARIAAKLADGYTMTIGVRVDSRGALMAGGGIGHWINLVSLRPFGVDNGAAVIYNSFDNTLTDVRYSALMQSAGAFGGGLTGAFARR